MFFHDRKNSISWCFFEQSAVHNTVKCKIKFVANNKEENGVKN